MAFIFSICRLLSSSPPPCLLLSSLCSGRQASGPVFWWSLSRGRCTGRREVGGLAEGGAEGDVGGEGGGEGGALGEEGSDGWVICDVGDGRDGKDLYEGFGGDDDQDYVLINFYYGCRDTAERRSMITTLEIEIFVTLVRERLAAVEVSPTS